MLVTLMGICSFLLRCYNRAVAPEYAERLIVRGYPTIWCYARVRTYLIRSWVSLNYANRWYCWTPTWSNPNLLSKLLLHPPGHLLPPVDKPTSLC